MKRSKYFLIFPAVILMLDAQPQFAQENPENIIDSSNVETIYQCEVHPQVLSNIDGRCPRCDLKYELRTVEEAFALLNDQGAKKPELSLNYITGVEVEDSVEVLADSSEVVDSVDAAAILAEYDFEVIDHDEDNMLYQCPNHPLELDDEEWDCGICESPFVLRSIDEVRTNILKMNPPKETEKQVEEAGSGAENNQ